MSHIRSRLAVIVLVLVIAAVAAFVQLHSSGSKHTLVADFRDASPLEVGSTVKASGVVVGTVTKIRLRQGEAHVDMRIDKDVLPVHQDARLTIKPVNILGETFIDLDPGTAAAPYLRGTLPAMHTGNALTLQGLLDTLNEPTAAGLAALVNTLGNGLENGGAETKLAIRRLVPAMTELSKLGGVLDDENTVLQQLLDQAEPVASTLAADDGRTVAKLVRSARDLLAATAVNDEAVRQTLASLPATITQARATLRVLSSTAGSTTAMLRGARPLTDQLVGFANDLDGFARSADPALASLRPVLDRADELIAQAAPVAASLRAGSPGLIQAGAGLNAAGDQLLDKHLGDLMTFVRYWALSTNGRDGLSHYFRGVFHLSPDALGDILQGLSGSKPGTGVAKPAKPTGPGGLLPGLPDLNGNLGNLFGSTLSGLSGLLGGSTSSSQRMSDDSATGLTSTQETNLLNQLLGAR